MGSAKISCTQILPVLKDLHEWLCTKPEYSNMYLHVNYHLTRVFRIDSWQFEVSNHVTYHIMQHLTTSCSAVTSKSALENHPSTFWRRHAKRSLMARVSVTSKEGWTGATRPYFWYDNEHSEFDSADIIDYILRKSVLYQKNDGRGHACPSFFLYDTDSGH